MGIRGRRSVEFVEPRGRSLGTRPTLPQFPSRLVELRGHGAGRFEVAREVVVEGDGDLSLRRRTKVLPR
jgi:hypothetical protein